MNAVDLVFPVAETAAAAPPPPLRLAAVGSGGNRCGHDPSRPRWFEPPPQHAPHPRIIGKMEEAVRAYFADPTVLPSLNAANGSARQQRSERREGCLALLGALVHYLDLVTLRVGIPQADGSFEGLTLAFLAEKAGLGLRRAERACRDLRKAGLVEVYPIARKTEDDRYKGLPAIRRLPVALFKVFGLSRGETAPDPEPPPPPPHPAGASSARPRAAPSPFSVVPDPLFAPRRRRARARNRPTRPNRPARPLASPVNCRTIKKQVSAHSPAPFAIRY